MPKKHRELLEAMEKQPKIKDYIFRKVPPLLKDKLIVGYNDCVAELLQFRRTHEQLIKNYIFKFLKKSGEPSTPQVPLAPVSYNGQALRESMANAQAQSTLPNQEYTGQATAQDHMRGDEDVVYSLQQKTAENLPINAGKPWQGEAIVEDDRPSDPKDIPSTTLKPETPSTHGTEGSGGTNPQEVIDDTIPSTLKCKIKVDETKSSKCNNKNEKTMLPYIKVPLITLIILIPFLILIKKTVFENISISH